jgi:hypothetical protein
LDTVAVAEREVFKRQVLLAVAVVVAAELRRV